MKGGVRHGERRQSRRLAEKDRVMLARAAAKKREEEIANETEYGRRLRVRNEKKAQRMQEALEKKFQEEKAAAAAVLKEADNFEKRKKNFLDFEIWRTQVLAYYDQVDPEKSKEQILKIALKYAEHQGEFWTRVQAKYGELLRNGPGGLRKQWYETNKRVFLPIYVSQRGPAEDFLQAGECAYSENAGWALYFNQQLVSNSLYWFNADCKDCLNVDFDPNDAYYANPGEVKGDDGGLPANIIEELGKEKLEKIAEIKGEVHLLDFLFAKGQAPDVASVGWEFKNDLNPSKDAIDKGEDDGGGQAHATETFSQHYEAFKTNVADKPDFWQEFQLGGEKKEESPEAAVMETIYFAGAKELRKIAITFDHIHDATDSGRASIETKKQFPKIKT